MIDLSNRSLYAGIIAALLAAVLAFALGAMPAVLIAVAAGFAWPVLWFAVQFVAARFVNVSGLVARATAAVEANNLDEATRLASVAEAAQHLR
jgi:hypothetical protein